MIAKLLSLSNTIFSYLQFHALLEEKKSQYSLPLILSLSYIITC